MGPMLRLVYCWCSRGMYISLITQVVHVLFRKIANNFNVMIL